MSEVKAQISERVGTKLLLLLLLLDEARAREAAFL